MAKARQSHRPPTQAKGTTGQRNGAARPQAGATRGTTSASPTPSPTNRAPAASPRGERIQARANQRRRYQKAPWWKQHNLPIFGTLGAVLVLILIFIFVANRSTGGSSAGPAAPASVVNPVTNVSAQVINTVGTGGLPNPIKAIPPSAGGGPLTTNGKPTVLYMGAEYCPYCAAERWSMIVALSRFGTFSNLHLTTSSSTDVYADTPTFTFYGSTYTSKYIDFQSVEETTRDQNTTLQTPTDQQNKLLSTYDVPQYVGGTTSGAIPFVNFGNQYVVSGAGFSPQILSGQTQQDIANKLNNASDPTTQQIVGNANYLTATICKLTNNQPGSVCTTGPIPGIEAQLPKSQ